MKYDVDFLFAFCYNKTIKKEEPKKRKEVTIMYKSSAFNRFWNWLCIVSNLIARIFVGSAAMALPTWLTVNRILWEANLPTLPYWWYWCLFNVVFGMRSLLFREGTFDDND